MKFTEFAGEFVMILIIHGVLLTIFNVHFDIAYLLVSSLAFTYIFGKVFRGKEED